MNTMTKTFVAFAGSMMLVACGSNDDASVAEVDEAAEVEVSDADLGGASCSEEEMIAKATELGEHMQAMAGDVEAMQAMAGRMQEIQAEIQAGAADGSFSYADACSAYDELLSAE